MLKFDQVSFSYGREEIISDVSFHIKKGEFVALIGENGAGKSTLSKLCIGLLKPVKGSVSICDMDTLKTRSSQIARHAGYLFQNPDRQICQKSVYDEIMFGLEYTIADEATRKSYCQETIERFDFDAKADPFHLSRGERQRLALASILAIHPEFLLLDEPTTGLDYRECMQMLQMIEELHHAGTTILMITHDMELVQDFAQRVLVMSEGRLIGNGVAAAIMQNESLLNRASVTAGQIQQLATALGDDFIGAASVETMLERLQYLKRRRA
ncbi:MAG: ABC transporter ATP-binding protein [Clostridia bacterium]|mgnify:CR=1 FL=1|nr:ABC transporter ATP-binding protein [Clostridia bacterium]